MGGARSSRGSHTPRGSREAENFQDTQFTMRSTLSLTIFASALVIMRTIVYAADHAAEAYNSGDTNELSAALSELGVANKVPDSKEGMQGYIEATIAEAMKKQEEARIAEENGAIPPPDPPITANSYS